MFETASEIVIWMVLAALVGFATGWALRSVVANRTRARLSERLEDKRRETQELREELRHLRGGDDVMQVPQLPATTPAWEDGDEYAAEPHEEPTLGATAEHDEVELGPLDEPGRRRAGSTSRGRSTSPSPPRRRAASEAPRAPCASRRSSGMTRRIRRRGGTTRPEASWQHERKSRRALAARAPATECAGVSRSRVRARRRAHHLVRAARGARLAAWQCAQVARRPRRGTRRDAVAQPPRAARGAFRRARVRWSTVRDQHAPRASRGALHRGALRRARAAAGP